MPALVIVTRVVLLVQTVEYLFLVGGVHAVQTAISMETAALMSAALEVNCMIMMQLYNIHVLERSIESAIT